MPQKPHRGFKTGNSIQKYPSRATRRKDYSHDDGLFILTTTTRRDIRPVTLYGSDAIDFNVPYSLKKRKRWLLPDFLRDRIEEGGLFKGHDVSVAECELDCYQRVRPTSLDLKGAGEDATLQHIEGRGTFVHRRCISRKRMWYDSDSDDDSDEEEEKKENEKKNDLIFDFLHANPRSKVAKKHRKRKEDEACDVAFYRWLCFVGLEKRSHDLDDNTPKKREKHSSLDLELLPSDFDAIAAEASQEAALDRIERGCEAHRANLQLSDCIVSTKKSPKRKVRKRLHSDTSEEKNRKDRKVFCLEAEEGEESKEEDEAKEEESSEIEKTKAEEPEEQLTSTPRILEDPGSSVPVRMTFPTHQVTPSTLLSQFADSYMEGESLPRKFAIRLTPATEDCSFLIFEEVRADERETVCDAFLNVDVSDVDPHCLINLKAQFNDADLDLASFVFLCVQCVSDTFEDSFERRDGTPVVLIHEKPSPLKHQEPPTIEEVPLTRVHQPPSPTFAISKAPADLFGTCDICFEEVAVGAAGDFLDERQEASCLRSCGHLFCTSCWRQHLASSIRQGHLRLRCPASDCSAEVDAITALRFVSLPLFTVLKRQQAADSLLRDPHVALCPNLACRRPVRSEHLPAKGEAMDIACVCRDQFCFSCREEAHWPASCRMYRLFKAKMISLGDWSLHQSKMVCVPGKCCPDCGRFIEKNGGCNSMQCLCGLDFCWQCSQPMREHDEFESNICGELEGRSVKPSDLENADVVYSFCHPDGVRSRSYCAALKLRLDRLRLRNTRRLDTSRIRELLYNEKLVKTKRCPFDRAHWRAVVHEAEEVARSYATILRVAEFCHVMCFALDRTEDCWPFAKQAGMSLEQLATQLRKVVEERKATSGAETRVELVRVLLQQARRRIGFIRSLRVLSEPLRTDARAGQRVR